MSSRIYGASENMTYIQETDPRIVPSPPLPAGDKDKTYGGYDGETVSQRSSLWNDAWQHQSETKGDSNEIILNLGDEEQDEWAHWKPYLLSIRLTESAYTVVTKVQNEIIADKAREILELMARIFVCYEDVGINMEHLPQLHAFVEEDGAVVMEWNTLDFRIVFAIESDSKQSSWHLVTNEKMGRINALGYLETSNLTEITLWLFNFVLLNSES